MTQCPIRRGSGQILGCGFLGLNPLLSGPRNGFWSIFGHLIEFGLVAQLSKQPQNGFYKVNQDMGRKFKTARVGPPLHGIGSVKSTVLIRENPQFMWPACDFFIFGYKLAIFGHLSSIFLVAKNDHKWRFGHSGQSEVFENGPNGFPMPRNLGIDTKIKSLACSERKLQIRPDMCTVLQNQPNSQIQPKWP